MTAMLGPAPAFSSAGSAAAAIASGRVLALPDEEAHEAA